MLAAYALKELTRRKTRSLFNVLAIFTSIGLLVCVLAITDFFQRAARLPFAASGADLIVETFTEPGPWQKVRTARHLGPISGKALRQIQRLPQVEKAAGTLHL